MIIYTDKKEFLSALQEHRVNKCFNSGIKNIHVNGGKDFKNPKNRNELSHNTYFYAAQFKDCSFEDLNFIDSCFERAILSDITFTNINFSKSNFHTSNMNNAKFKDINFKDADFTRARLDNVVFEDVNLRGTDFSDATLIDVDFRKVRDPNEIIVSKGTSIKGLKLTLKDESVAFIMKCKKTGINIDDIAWYGENGKQIKSGCIVLKNKKDLVKTESPKNT